MSRGIGHRIRKSIKRVRTVVYLSLHAVLVLVGALISATSGPIGVAIGTSVIATGISGMIVFGWIMFSEEDAERRKAIDEFGFVTAFPHRSIQIKQEYETRIARAEHQIDIMGFGLNALREDFSEKFQEWANRAEVRVLLVDPHSPHPEHSFTSLRDREERNNARKTDDEIRRFIEETRHLWSDPSIRFYLRLATTLPSVNMFRIDDESFWGPYLIMSGKSGRASRNLPTMIVKRPGYMYERLADHFEEIWSNDDLSSSPERSDVQHGT
ncbi:hypothetical protein [Amycolatopsis sp. NPDC051061]|uniref:hypothetical protein n=1 Tax=Amycolatopsis sp. NPDC051061 TaxID=3155042 RepID=UPI00341843B7